MDTQIHRHTDTQTTDIQTNRYIDTEIHRHTDTQTYRHTDTQIHRQTAYTDTQFNRNIDIQTHRHKELQNTNSFFCKEIIINIQKKFTIFKFRANIRLSSRLYSNPGFTPTHEFKN